MNTNIISIDYRNEGGHVCHMTADLSGLLPCSAVNMRRLCDIISMSSESESHAAAVADFIAGRVAELKSRRDSMTDRTPRERAERQKINTTLKKYISNSEKLAERFNLDAETAGDENAKIKMTAGNVYAMTRDGIEIHSGYTFKKGGFCFEVYKRDDRGGVYIILLAGTGLQVATATKRTAAPYEITEQIINILSNKDNREKMTTARARFAEAMTAAGFDYEEPETEKEQEKEPEKEPETESEQEKEKEQETKTEREEAPAMTTHYFKHCKTLDDVKKAFKTAARELHPDNGGDPEQFKMMMSDYTETFNRLKNLRRGADGSIYETETDETPAEFADVINAIINLDGVKIEICGSWVWVTGNTYPAREALKAAGLRFASKKIAWYYVLGDWKKHGKGMTLDKIRERHGSQTIANRAPAFRLVAG